VLIGLCLHLHCRLHAFEPACVAQLFAALCVYLSAGAASLRRSELELTEVAHLMS
jgi:hypothetical protein